MKRFRHNAEAGFTIIELMIATMVFSTILLVVTYGVLHFTSSYYKGVNSSTTQNTARSVMDTVSQAVQLSGDPVTNSQPSGNLTYFCAAGHIFVYSLGVQYMGGTPTASNPGLYEWPSNACDPSIVQYNDPNGQELLAKHMRLAQLTVFSSDSQTYAINIRLAFSSGGNANADGDDLLCSPSVASSCQPNQPNLTNFALNDLQCKTQIGSQFCAVSPLSTTVVKRVDGSS